MIALSTSDYWATLPVLASVRFFLRSLHRATGRVEFLRPFLTRLDLFPSRLNPENAPIRMEELRALVRKWNLHHKRNFWRENPTKDDVVAALNQHVKHMEVVHDNIETKKAERREADRKRQMQIATGEVACLPRVVTSTSQTPQMGSTSDTFLYRQGVALPRLERPADSELPADSIETGIIYMSRWGQDNARTDDSARTGTEVVAFNADVEGERAVPAQYDIKEDDADESCDANDAASNIQAQQKCSLALLNMTMRDQVGVQIVWRSR